MQDELEPSPPPPFGGYTEVARRLSDAGPRAVSRQGVYSWWRRRAKSGFPDYHHLDDDGWKQWDVSEVLGWYTGYTPPVECHWGRRRKEHTGVSA